MADSISSSIIACLRAFNEFIRGIKDARKENMRGLIPESWEDELGRLRMWAANIGAHQTGQSSLDFRLRDASHVRNQIIKLLQGLLRRLQDVRDVLADSEESDGEQTADGPLDEEDPESELQELRESIATNINCLFQMSMLVRKPAQHDVTLGSKRADVVAYEPFDYDHIRDKFPKADDALVQRLAKANTRRRKYLKYRERHAAKLKLGISSIDPGARNFHESLEDETAKTVTQSILSDTVATDFQGQNIDYDDNASDTGISQTSYAPTLLSGGHVAIPAPPKSSLGGAPFECPYCFFVITVSGTRSWNKHVFGDLQPYICVASTCTTRDKLYSTRHEWLHHSKIVHPIAPVDNYKTEERTLCVACPLCKEGIEPGKQYDRHLARHLQEIALFILPGGEEESDVNDDKGTESDSHADSENLVASDDGRDSLGGLSSSLDEYPALVDSPDTSNEIQESGDHTKRMIDLEEQFVDMQRHLEPDHPNLLTGMLDLAVSYSKLGEHEKAINLATQVVETRTKVLKPNHPDLMASKAELGRMYYRQGKYEKATDLAEEVLQSRELVLGREHRMTLESMNDLGRSYSRQGLWAKAEALEIEALTFGEKIGGPEHPYTLSMLNNLASLYAQQGKLMEAESVCRRLLIGSEKTLGREHPSTLNTLRSLAILYSQQGKLMEAESMYQRVMIGSEKTLGREHPSTLITLSDLANLYTQQRKLMEAESMYQRVLIGSEKTLGSEDPLTLNTLNTLANLYTQQGKLMEAESMYRRLLIGFEKRLGREHLSTVYTFYKLGSLYRQQGRFADAESLYLRALDGFKKRLGADHDSTIRAANDLGNLYKAQGRLAEAEELFQSARNVGDQN